MSLGNNLGAIIEMTRENMEQTVNPEEWDRFRSSEHSKYQRGEETSSM